MVTSHRLTLEVVTLVASLVGENGCFGHRVFLEDIKKVLMAEERIKHYHQGVGGIHNEGLQEGF
jgi:hypothetical protein